MCTLMPLDPETSRSFVGVHGCRKVHDSFQDVSDITVPVVERWTHVIRYNKLERMSVRCWRNRDVIAELVIFCDTIAELVIFCDTIVLTRSDATTALTTVGITVSSMDTFRSFAVDVNRVFSRPKPCEEIWVDELIIEKCLRSETSCSRCLGMVAHSPCVDPIKGRGSAPSRWW